MTTTIDFIVPTLKRPDHLKRCLESLAQQSVSPTQVFVGIRGDDDTSREVLRMFDSSLDVCAVDVEGVGVVGSMNSCLAKCQSDFIGFVDDDVELPADWIELMLRHLESRPNVVVCGGRDLLMDHPEMRRTEKPVEDVGRIHLYGRITGNHHRGGGAPREVDILRGSNCLCRGDFLRRAGFEKSLAGKGAQVNWELALAFRAKSEGFRLFFDPTVRVIHHVAPRHDNDTVHRGIFDAAATSDIAHNESLAVLKHARGLTRFTALLWQATVGSQTCPGVMRVLESLIPSRPPFWPRFTATMRGRLLAVRTLMTGTEHAG